MALPQRGLGTFSGLHPIGAQFKSAPQGICFRCHQVGHWACTCPNLGQPNKLCPICQQPGHWKSKWPHVDSLPVPIYRGSVQAAQAPKTLSAFEILSLTNPRLSNLHHPREAQGKSISFLTDTGSTFSVINSYSGPTISSPISVTEVDRTPTFPPKTPLPPTFLQDNIFHTLFWSCLTAWFLCSAVISSATLGLPSLSPP